MKKNLLLLFLICSQSSLYAQNNLNNPDFLISSSIEDIVLVHMSSDLNKNNSEVKIGQKIGTIDKLPKKTSIKNDSKIKKSKEHYKNGEYEKAYEILINSIENEPNNPFILEPIARAQYKLPSKQKESFENYKLLIHQLDSLNGTSKTKITVDMWFIESYWKLGTLYMDNSEWKKAQYEINRFLMSIQNMKGSVIYVQALAYLTECFFELDNQELYKHFANRTLIYDPNNEYAKNCLKISD